MFLKKKNNRAWYKKEKMIDWNTSFNKRCYILRNQMQVCKKKKVTQLNHSTVESYLNQSTNQLTPLLRGQINLIKFVESNKFDGAYSKIWNIPATSKF